MPSNGTQQTRATDGPVAVVTGSSSGIGRTIAEAWAARGGRVVLSGRNETRLAEVAESIGDRTRVAIVAGDVYERENAIRVVEAAAERFGRLDLLVNNAGHFDVKPVADYSGDDFEGYIGFLRAAFFASQAAIAQFRKQDGGEGSIVNISTNLTTRGVSGIPSSGPVAGKGGIQSITHSLAIELAGEGIRVNAVAPGIVRTPLIDADDAGWASLAKLHPMGRVGEASDVSDAVLYLADARWVTGVVLPVDGGIAAGA